jgi:hypothetical protein
LQANLATVKCTGSFMQASGQAIMSQGLLEDQLHGRVHIHRLICCRGSSRGLLLILLHCHDLFLSVCGTAAISEHQSMQLTTRTSRLWEFDGPTGKTTSRKYIPVRHYGPRQLKTASLVWLSSRRNLHNTKEASPTANSVNDGPEG